METLIQGELAIGREAEVHAHAHACTFGTFLVTGFTAGFWDTWGVVEKDH